MRDVFNSRFSIYRFLKEALADLCPGLDIFLNTVPRPHEEQRMRESERYLVIDVRHGELRYDQPVDVSLALYVTPSADPTTLWMQHFPDQLAQLCLQRRTSADGAMIALYDYDAACGDSAVTAFLRTGVLPVNFLSVLESTHQEVTYNGRDIGLKALPSSRTPVFEFGGSPYRAIWHLEFAYFHPGHIIGSAL